MHHCLPRFTTQILDIFAVRLSVCTVQYTYHPPRGTAACCISLTISDGILPRILSRLVAYPASYSGRPVSYIGLETGYLTEEFAVSGYESLQY
jgi:hypothetical protein